MHYSDDDGEFEHVQSAKGRVYVERHTKSMRGQNNGRELVFADPGQSITCRCLAWAYLVEHALPVLKHSKVFTAAC